MLFMVNLVECQFPLIYVYILFIIHAFVCVTFIVLVN